MSLFNNYGPLAGAPAPLHVTGRYYPPHLYVSDVVSALAVTATRIYYVPYYVWEIRSYAGFVMRNTGAGDNGKKCRMGLYSHTAVGPTTLVQAATEVTFSGAAADNVTANAFTPTYIGWHWIAAQFDMASSVKRCIIQNTSQSAVGSIGVPPTAPFFGVISASGDLATAAVGSYYVDTAYAVLAANAVAPTATTDVTPWIALVA